MDVQEVATRVTVLEKHLEGLEAGLAALRQDHESLDRSTAESGTSLLEKLEGLKQRQEINDERVLRLLEEARAQVAASPGAADTAQRERTPVEQMVTSSATQESAIPQQGVTASASAAGTMQREDTPME